MPLYDYACSCGNTQEFEAAFGQKPEYLNCACGGKLTHVLTPFTAIFKGSGFTKSISTTPNE